MTPLPVLFYLHAEAPALAQRLDQDQEILGMEEISKAAPPGSSHGHMLIPRKPKLQRRGFAAAGIRWIRQGRVGFLKISHKYEITFLLPDSQSLRQETSCAPVPNLYLKLVDIAPVTEGYRVKCEYIAHKEGVIREEMIMTNKINNNASVKVTLQARVLDRLHGTPMLLEGVKCIGSEPEYDSEQSDWQGFD
ncbi:adipose-secreted signaling protein isoform X3 [Cetorhinus maximus]